MTLNSGLQNIFRSCSGSDVIPSDRRLTYTSCATSRLRYWLRERLPYTLVGDPKFWCAACPNCKAKHKGLRAFCLRVRRVYHRTRKVKRGVLGISGPQSVKKVETVRRKVTTGNKGGAKGFQPRTASHNEKRCIMGMGLSYGVCVEYLDVRELRLIALNYLYILPYHVGSSIHWTVDWTSWILTADELILP